MTIQVLMKALQTDCVDPRNSYQMQEVIGCSKGGLIIKIHTAVDALGNPVRFMLSPGQGPDCTQALLLLRRVHHTGRDCRQGYDSDEIVNWIASRDAQVVIPPRSIRKTPRNYGDALYAE